MKNNIKVILILIFSFFLVGCTSVEQNSNSNVKSPQNNDLGISGIWESDEYEVLDKNILTNEDISEIIGVNLKFGLNTAEIGNKKFEGVSYKLKLVKSDYTISYESKFKTKDLGINDKEVKVYSITYDNNLLGEIINISEEESYFYYQGILFKMKREGDIPESSEKDTATVGSSEDNKDGTSETSQGVYIGLKVEGKQDGEGNYTREEYRTIWISTDSGVLQSVKQRKNIIFPRNRGMWVLQPKEFKMQEKSIYYEFFDAMPLEKENIDEKKTYNNGNISQGKIVRRSINYIGNDYLATEVTSNEIFSESPVYEVLPIDNILTKGGIVIGDILGAESNKIFKEAYDSTYSNIDKTNKDKLSKYINYSNYTLIRNNGKWVLQGRISPVISGGKTFDYSLNIKANKALINYDTLIIPWKVLKGDIPLLTDAFTSPNGRLAIILTKNELDIYKVVDGKLEQTPIKKIALKEGEKVIMDEWCEGEYVNKWDTSFKENSSIIE